MSKSAPKAGIRRRGAAAAAALAVLVASGVAAAAQVALVPGQSMVMPGGTFTMIAMKSSSPGDQVASLSMDLSYDAARFGPPSSCFLLGAAASSKTLATSQPVAGIARLGVLGINQSTIPDGALAICFFPALANAPIGLARFGASVGAATPGGTSVAASGGWAEVSVGSDGDGDSVMDGSDNCPYASNPDQADRGGVGAGSLADGIGDACQCGDITGDGRVSVADVTVLRRSLLIPPTATQTRPQLCDVGGSAGCSLADSVIISRALLTPPTAVISAACDPASP